LALAYQLQVRCWSTSYCKYLHLVDYLFRLQALGAGLNLA